MLTFVTEFCDLYIYGDMTPESRNSSLLDNGSLGTLPQERIRLWENQTVATKLIHVSSATNRHAVIEELIGGDLYSVLPKLSKETCN
jgi:hypothetical protein